MQQVTINNEVYEIPVSWSELNYWQAVQCLKLVDDKGKQLSLLAKMPIQLIDAMPDISIQQLFSLISFTESLEVFESIEVLEEYKSFDFGTIEYGKAEKIRQIMSKDISGFEVSAEAIKLLYGKDINEIPFTEVIGTANFFLSKLIVSTIVSPSLAKMNQVLSKDKLELKDSLNLGALQRMLNLQGQEH